MSARGKKKIMNKQRGPGSSGSTGDYFTKFSLVSLSCFTKTPVLNLIKIPARPLLEIYLAQAL